MKYFTQELFVRAQSQDDRVLEEVDALWDAQCEQYAAYVDSVKEQMPPGLRQRIDRYYLHDAVIRGMGTHKASFVIIVQLDTPPQSLLTFTYDLLSVPIIQRNTLPPDVCTAGPVVDWQYDEIEMVPGNPPTWRQSILLSNGWELALHFTDVSVQEFDAMIPAPCNGELAGAGCSDRQLNSAGSS